MRPLHPDNHHVAQIPSIGGERGGKNYDDDTRERRQQCLSAATFVSLTLCRKSGMMPGWVKQVRSARAWVGSAAAAAGSDQLLPSSTSFTLR